MEAVDRANKDWENENAYSLIFGELSHKFPVLNKKVGLYFSQYIYSEEGDPFEFCSIYNGRILELISKFGIQNWFPINRLPKRDSLINKLQTSKLIKHYESNSIQEKRIFELVSQTWKKSLQVWARDFENDILIFGGNVNDKCGRIDVIDLEKNLWMDTQEYFRQKVNFFPWD